jgi:hypothetical protein
MRRLMLGLLICSSLSSVVAGPLEDGAVAYERGDYATTMRLMRPMAEQGDARSPLSCLPPTPVPLTPCLVGLRRSLVRVRTGIDHPDSNQVLH